MKKCWNFEKPRTLSLSRIILVPLKKVCICIIKTAWVPFEVLLSNGLNWEVTILQPNGMSPVAWVPFGCNDYLSLRSNLKVNPQRAQVVSLIYNLSNKILSNFKLYSNTCHKIYSLPDMQNVWTGLYILTDFFFFSLPLATSKLSLPCFSTTLFTHNFGKFSWFLYFFVKLWGK